MRGSLIETMRRGLHPHRARQGAVRAPRGPAPRRARRDQPDRDDPRARHRRRCSAARSSSKRSSTSPGRPARLRRDHARGPARSCRARCCSAALFIIVANIIVDIAYAFSTRGCGTRERRRAAAASRGPARRVPHRRRGRARRRRHHLRGRSRDARSGSSASPGSGKTVSSLTTLGLTRVQGARDQRADHVRGARPADARRTTSCARSAATTSR